MATYVVTEARAGQTEAVLSLLPELLQAPALPPAFLVAHRVGAPSEIVGAAAYVPAMHAARLPGFRGLCRVLEAYRRHGIGRALVARLAADVAAWDVAHLLSWEARPDGPASAFLRALGFEVNFTLHHFIGDYATMAPVCERMTRALAARRRVPPGVRLAPLADGPLDAVIALHCQAFHAAPADARAEFDGELAHPLSRRLSLALWDGSHVLGYLLAGGDGDLPVLRFWASDPACRSGWAAILLLDGYTRAVHACGLSQSRFTANADSPAPMNIAAKIGARREGVDTAHVLDLAVPDRNVPALDVPDLATSPA